MPIMVKVARPLGRIFCAGVDLQVFAVAGHRDVGEMLIHGAGRQNVGCVYRRALGFMDRDRVAMIEALMR